MMLSFLRGLKERIQALLKGGADMPIEKPEIVTQLSYGLDPLIATQGCAVLCMMYAAYYNMDKPMNSVGDVNELVHQLVTAGIVDPDLNCWAEGGGFAAVHNFVSANKCQWIEYRDLSENGFELKVYNTPYEYLGGRHYMISGPWGIYDPMKGECNCTYDSSIFYQWEK